MSVIVLIILLQVALIVAAVGEGCLILALDLRFKLLLDILAASLLLGADFLFVWFCCHWRANQRNFQVP